MSVAPGLPAPPHRDQKEPDPSRGPEASLALAPCRPHDLPSRHTALTRTFCSSLGGFLFLKPSVLLPQGLCTSCSLFLERSSPGQPHHLTLSEPSLTGGATPTRLFPSQGQRCRTVVACTLRNGNSQGAQVSVCLSHWVPIDSTGVRLSHWATLGIFCSSRRNGHAQAVHTLSLPYLSHQASL